MECIFCKIVAGEVPSKIVYQDEEVMAFPDIHPEAPVHLLIIPKKHIPSLAHLTEADAPLAGHMVIVATQLGKKYGVAESGYRLVINSGEQGGQVIPHLHLHLIGGRRLADRLS